MSESVGSWTVNYLPEEGGRYTGTLEVKDSGLHFDTLYESSNKTIVKAIFVDVATFAAAGGHTSTGTQTTRRRSLICRHRTSRGLRPPSRG